MPRTTTESLVTRPAPSRILTSTGVVAVLRAPAARACSPVIDALISGGVLSIELTLSTPGVVEELPLLLSRFGGTVELGVGTVTTAHQAAAVIDAGASYIVTPITLPAIIETALARNIPVYPGGLTPTELHTAWALGSTAVKLFPAATVGPGYISQLRGPFPDIQVIPSGGINIDDVPGWIRAGALAVSLGGPLIGDAFRGGDLTQLTERASLVRKLVDETRAAL